MSFNNNSIQSNIHSVRGFTIVELLIVIVVIGILAAITIVSFNGVSARAKAATAESAATAAIKKAEAYNAETSAYPTAPANLTDSSAASKSYFLTGATFNTTGANGAPLATAPGSPSVLNFYNCTTGQRIDYWDYSASPAAWTPVLTGGATVANCGASAYIKV